MLLKIIETIQGLLLALVEEGHGRRRTFESNGEK